MRTFYFTRLFYWTFYLRVLLIRTFSSRVLPNRVFYYRKFLLWKFLVRTFFSQEFLMELWNLYMIGRFLCGSYDQSYRKFLETDIKFYYKSSWHLQFNNWQNGGWSRSSRALWVQRFVAGTCTDCRSSHLNWRLKDWLLFLKFYSW